MRSNKKWRRLLTAWGLVCALALAGCGGSTAPAASGAESAKEEEAVQEETEAAPDSAEAVTAEGGSESPEAQASAAAVSTGAAAGETAAEAVSGEEMLSLWTEDAPLKKELVAYMDSITREDSADYIPEDCRIAVFDLDGTLFCETDPNYFDYCLLVHRVLEDPDYKDRASDFERQTAEKIVQQNETGESFEGLELDHGQCIASSFAGMTIDEFSNYIQEFKKLPMPSYEGMTRGEGFYLPML